MTKCRKLSVMFVSLTFTSCQSTIFAVPEYTYRSGDSVGVDFVNVGFSQDTNEAGAMKLIADYCRGRGMAFRVTGRAEREKVSVIDAVCTK